MSRGIGLLAAVVLGICSTCLGQTGKPAAAPSDDVESLEKQVIEASMKHLRESAPVKYRSQLQSLSYQIINDDDPFIMRIAVSKNVPVFEISSGALNLLMQLAYGQASETFMPNSATKFNQWLLEVGRKLKKGDYAYRGFLEYAGEKEPSSKYLSAVFRINFLTSLTYVIAHECSHVLLGHTKYLGSQIPRERLRAMENEADALTVDLLARVAGDNAQAFAFYGTGYFTLFMLTATVNRDVLAFPEMRDHPPEFERAARMAREFKKRAKTIKFSDENGTVFVERALDQQIASYDTYRLIVEYQNYLYSPGSQDLSFEEWRKKYKKH